MIRLYFACCCLSSQYPLRCLPALVSVVLVPVRASAGAGWTSRRGARNATVAASRFSRRPLPLRRLWPLAVVARHDSPSWGGGGRACWRPPPPPRRRPRIIVRGGVGCLVGGTVLGSDGMDGGGHWRCASPPFPRRAPAPSGVSVCCVACYSLHGRDNRWVDAGRGSRPRPTPPIEHAPPPSTI